ncbi:hypothetical protein [Bradyrhizobium sp. USDA 4353]
MGTSSRLIFCSVAGLALSPFFASVCHAVEIPKPVVNVPKPAIPRPNIVVPKPNIVANVPKPVVNVPKPTVTVNVPKPAVVVPKVDVPKPAVAVTVVPKVETPRPVVAAPKVDLPRSAGPQTVVNIPKSSAPPAVIDVPKQTVPSVQATTLVVSNPAAGSPVAQPNVKLETPPKTSGPVNPRVLPVGTPKSVTDGNLPKTAAPVLSPANPTVENPKEPGIASGPPKAAEPLTSSTAVSAAPKHEAGALSAKNAGTVPSASSPPKQADSAKLQVPAAGSNPRSGDAKGGAGSGSAGSAVSSNASGAASAGPISSNASSGSLAASPSATAASPANAKIGVAKSESEPAQANTSATPNALSVSSSSGGSAAKSSSGSAPNSVSNTRPAGTVTLSPTGNPTCNPSPCQSGQIYTAQNGQYGGADVVVSGNSVTPTSTTIQYGGISATVTAAGGGSSQNINISGGGTSANIDGNGGASAPFSGIAGGQTVSSSTVAGVTSVTVGGQSIANCGYSTCSVTVPVSSPVSAAQRNNVSQDGFAIGRGRADYDAGISLRPTTTPSNVQNVMSSISNIVLPRANADPELTAPAERTNTTIDGVNYEWTKDTPQGRVFYNSEGSAYWIEPNGKTYQNGPTGDQGSVVYEGSRGSGFTGELSGNQGRTGIQGDQGRDSSARSIFSDGSSGEQSRSGIRGDQGADTAGRPNVADSSAGEQGNGGIRGGQDGNNTSTELSKYGTQAAVGNGNQLLGDNANSSNSNSRQSIPDASNLGASSCVGFPCADNPNDRKVLMDAGILPQEPQSTSRSSASPSIANPIGPSDPTLPTPEQVQEGNAPVAGNLPPATRTYTVEGGGTAYQTPEGKRGWVAYPPQQDLFGAISNQYNKQVTPANGYKQ